MVEFVQYRYSAFMLRHIVVVTTVANMVTQRHFEGTVTWEPTERKWLPINQGIMIPFVRSLELVEMRRLEHNEMYF
jgi:hypothetical protein